MHPFVISITFSSCCCTWGWMRLPSIFNSLISFTMTAYRFPLWSLLSMCCSKVVFPAPRKPDRTVTGSFLNDDAVSFAPSTSEVATFKESRDLLWQFSSLPHLWKTLENELIWIRREKPNSVTTLAERTAEKFACAMTGNYRLNEGRMLPCLGNSGIVLWVIGLLSASFTSIAEQSQSLWLEHGYLGICRWPREFNSFIWLQQSASVRHLTCVMLSLTHEVLPNDPSLKENDWVLEIQVNFFQSDAFRCRYVGDDCSFRVQWEAISSCQFSIREVNVIIVFGDASCSLWWSYVLLSSLWPFCGEEGC